MTQNQINRTSAAIENIQMVLKNKKELQKLLSTLKEFDISMLEDIFVRQNKDHIFKFYPICNKYKKHQDQRIITIIILVNKFHVKPCQIAILSKTQKDKENNIMYLFDINKSTSLNEIEDMLMAINDQLIAPTLPLFAKSV